MRLLRMRHGGLEASSTSQVRRTPSVNAPTEAWRSEPASVTWLWAARRAMAGMAGWMRATHGDSEPWPPARRGAEADGLPGLPLGLLLGLALGDAAGRPQLPERRRRLLELHRGGLRAVDLPHLPGGAPGALEPERPGRALAHHPDRPAGPDAAGPALPHLDASPAARLLRRRAPLDGDSRKPHHRRQRILDQDPRPVALPARWPGHQRQGRGHAALVRAPLDDGAALAGGRQRVHRPLRAEGERQADPLPGPGLRALPRLPGPGQCPQGAFAAALAVARDLQRRGS